MANAHVDFDQVNRRIMLETAFLDYNQFSNISDADLEVLYQRVEKIKQDYLSDQEYTLEPMAKFDLESISSKADLKKRIEEKRAEIAGAIFEQINIGADKDAAARSEEEKFIKGFLEKLKISSKTDAQLLAQAIMDRKLNESYDPKMSKAERLGRLLNGRSKELKEKLLQDYDLYKKAQKPHPEIEKMSDDIANYTSGGERFVVLHYIVETEDKPFRGKIRDDFNLGVLSKKPGVKKTFLTLYGAMMQAGKDIVYGEKTVMGYDLFEKTMKDWYGPVYQEEMKKALKTDDFADCKEKFFQKSKSLYVKTATALLSKKKEFDAKNKIYDTNYGDYLATTINHKYIRGLQNGENPVAALGLVDIDPTDEKLSRAEEYRLNRQIYDEMADRQHVSIHHKLPVGSAKNVLQRLYAKVFNRVEALVEACKLVNNLGNMELIVGREKHQSIEPRGDYKMTARKDDAIFEARLNPAYVKELSLDRSIAPVMREELKRFENQTDIKETMAFSESVTIAQERSKLKSSCGSSIQNSIVNKFKSYFN